MVDFRILKLRRAITPQQRAKMFLESIVQRQLQVDGVFEGGGALGAAYIGALRALHDSGLWFARVAGNSAGAITASMVAAGFTAPEIQWLCSSFPDRPPAPASLQNAGITQPIAFGTFLDLPRREDISLNSKRRTLLWKALKGELLDELGRIEIPVPTQAAAVNASVNAILGSTVLGPVLTGVPGGRTALTAALNAALAPLPNTPLRVADVLPTAEGLRITLADRLWDLVADRYPIYTLQTNLVHEGAIFEGDEFLATMKRLLGLKVHRDPDALVRFRDLPIPLAVIAANIETGAMLVYSSRNDANMQVAEAVRRSMSIPFVFEPRGNRRQLVDGGVFSNFPLWLFTAGGDEHWPAASVDANRLKIGFSLDDQRVADPDWNADEPRFEVDGTPPHVDLIEVMRPILEEKLVELGYGRVVAAAAMAEALGVDPNTGNQSLEPGVAVLQEAFGVMARGILNTEEATRKAIVAGLMDGKRYVDISIPVLGYHVLDFFINEDERALRAMWDRGWQQAIIRLTAAKQGNMLPPLVRVASGRPFN